MALQRRRLPRRHLGDNGQLLHGTPQNGLAHVEKLLVRPDGTINGTLNGVLVTFNPDGSLARPIQDPTAWIHGDTLTLLSDGKLLYGRDQGGGFSFVRLMPDGVTPDPTFDSAAVHEIGAYLESLRGVAVMPDGRILVGVVGRNGTNDPDVGTLVRLLPDGRRDPEFPAAAQLSDPWTMEGAMQPFLTGPAEVTVVGMAKVNLNPTPYGSHDLMLARYELDPPLSVDPGGPYVVDEGTPFSVAVGSASYPAGEITRYEWDSNYDNVALTPEATGAAATLKFADDRPAPRPVLRVTTSDGLVALVPVDVTVRNVAPVITRLTAPDLAVKGVAATVSATFTDPGADTWRTTFFFSDDNSSQNVAANGSKTFSANHAFARGSYTVIADVSDDDGGSDTAHANGKAVDILGTVYKDVNDDGRLDAIDRPWPGVEVYLDRDDDGVADETEEHAATDAAGRYWFNVQANGTYSVRLVTTPDGWRYSTAAGARARPVVTATTGSRADFGLSQQGRITGTVFNDINHNGVRDPGENAVTGPGALPFVDLDNDGRWDPQEPQASLVPRAAGKYLITNLAPGTYTVRFTTEQPSTWVATGPAARTGYTVTVGPAQTAGDYDFARALSSAFLRGAVFQDSNNDGVRNNGETGTDGWTVYLDANDNGTLDPDEQRTEVTGAFGEWSMGVEPGPYVLRLQPRDGQTQTAPSPTGAAGGAIRGSVVTSEQKTNLNFGYALTGAPTFVGAHLFFENSGYDSQDPNFHSEANDAAILPDKQPLDPGQTGTFANVSGYSRGLNGIGIDLRNTLASNFDFSVRFSRGGVSPAWASVPPFRFALRRGDGPGGTDRFDLTFPDNAIHDGWVEVTVAANIHTGLSVPKKFYFGHLTGNVVGGGASELAVDSRDLAAVRRRATSFGDATITRTGVIDPMDVNADGLVDQADLFIVRANLGYRLEPLKAPAAPPAAAAATRNRTTRRSASYILE